MNKATDVRFRRLEEAVTRLQRKDGTWTHARIPLREISREWNEYKKQCEKMVHIYRYYVDGPFYDELRKDVQEKMIDDIKYAEKYVASYINFADDIGEVE
jgi:hypothetical protein